MWGAVWKLAHQLFLEGLPDFKWDAARAALWIAWQGGRQANERVARVAGEKANEEGRAG